LPQDFEHVARELRQLVEKEHAIVRQRDLARTRHRRASADQSGIGNGVVRRAIWTRAPTSPAPASSTPATLWILVVSIAKPNPMTR
jgi:hypothetical protein